jgi:DNA-binding transcriptional MerR regulator
MAIKMAQLMKETGETRSTLLYYVKEGLLQEPSKPKPNVHLYADDSIARIRLIKTLQQQLHYSIAQIKQVFDDNQFDFEEGSESLTQRLELFSGVKEKHYRSLDEAEQVFGVTHTELETYVTQGLLELHEGFLSDHSWKVLEVLHALKGVNKSEALLKRYVEVAKELAALEYDLGVSLLEHDKGDTNHSQELFLDLILVLKPYLLNMHTKAEHQRRCDEQ